jgi:hypothetical protein
VCHNLKMFPYGLRQVCHPGDSSVRQNGRAARPGQKV